MLVDDIWHGMLVLIVCIFMLDVRNLKEIRNILWSIGFSSAELYADPI